MKTSQVYLPDDYEDRPWSLAVEGHVIDGATGALHQVVGERPLKRYDAEYVAYYDQFDCGPLSGLRWRHLVLHTQLARHCRLLDFGCGNGAFLKWARSDRIYQPDVFAHDISGYPLDKSLVSLTLEEITGNHLMAIAGGDPMAFDVITFYDSLEHVPDPLALLRSLRMNYVVVSVPWFHGYTRGVAWFANWKHRKPFEHLWYFDACSLCELLGLAGFRPLAVGNPEDQIRRPVDHRPNILTGVFVRARTD